MNKNVDPRTISSTCPHDCPSTCGLKIDLDENRQVSRVRGAAENTYTAGVICAKVSRYAERIHHPDRLTKSYRRIGVRGDGEFQEIAFEDALDEVAEAFLKATDKYGAETIWPYYFAGTMGLVQRDCINRFRNVLGYSKQHSTICTTPAFAGFVVGTGRLGGVDPREMAQSDCIVIWGTNPVATQVNVMTHAVRARKERGAKIVVVDIYETGTMKQADHKVIIRPGTDGALATAVMHILFRDGHADWDFLETFSDDPRGFEKHLKDKTPEWAAHITGLDVATIEDFAALIGKNKRSFFRIGYGFSRQQNGIVNMHAVTSIPAVTGAWQHEGGGALLSNSGSFPFNNDVIQGLELPADNRRSLDQSRIGAVLCGEEADLYGGPPVTGLFVQNTNPALVAPDLRKVKQGFMRDDLFVCVHEQFMTETAELADIVLPATMFTEHDDVYRSGGHTHMSLGLKGMEPPEGCHSNYEVVSGLVKRLGVDDPEFKLTARAHVDKIVKTAHLPGVDAIENDPWQDVLNDQDRARYKDGFAWPDGKYRFKPKWDDVLPPFKSPERMGKMGAHDQMPEWPDHWAVNETRDETHPFDLATSPARQFLNSSFTETPTGQKREVRPTLMIHPDDAAAHNIGNHDQVIVGNEQGEVTLHAKLFDKLIPSTLIAEGIWPNKAHVKGEGINTLITARPVAPFGGASFHDCKVWLKRAT